MSEKKFYICETCGNLIGMIHSSGVNVVCCGKKMTELEAGVVEASHEKHIPVVEVKEGVVSVNVGSVIHPMSDAHHIGWIYLETDKGSQKKVLDPNGGPIATFILSDERPIAVYAWCNLHGLWKAEI